MRTKNAMQLKARVNNRAREAGIPAQMMMQNYLLERLLDRLSRSCWRDRVVVKGGMLISSLVGVASRTTMDLDTTVRGFDLTHESAEAVFQDIIAVEADDDWNFEFMRTESIPPKAYEKLMQRPSPVGDAFSMRLRKMARCLPFGGNTRRRIPMQQVSLSEKPARRLKK